MHLLVLAAVKKLYRPVALSWTVNELHSNFIFLHNHLSTLLNTECDNSGGTFEWPQQGSFFSFSSHHFCPTASTVRVNSNCRLAYKTIILLPKFLRLVFQLQQHLSLCVYSKDFFLCRVVGKLSFTHKKVPSVFFPFESFEVNIQNTLQTGLQLLDRC